MDNNIYISCNAIVSNDNWSLSYLYKGKIVSISLERLNRIKEFPDKYFADLLPSFQNEVFNGVKEKGSIIYKFKKYVDSLINSTLKREINFDEVEDIYLMNFPFDISISGYEYKVKKSYKMNFHHLFHASSAYFPSQFEEAAILCMDHDGCDEELGGVNPMHSIWKAEANKIDFLHSDNFDPSNYKLGIGASYFLHSKICSLKEGSFMGLSGYGNIEKYKDINIFEYSDDGVYINKDFYDKTKTYDFIKKSYDVDYEKEILIENDLINSLKKAYDIENYTNSDIINSKYADIAEKVQIETEEAILFLAKKAYNLTKSKNLCISGGVGLNILANTRILKETPFENVFVQPACSDEGLSLGGLYYLYNIILNNKQRFYLESPGIGFSYSESDIISSIEQFSSKLTFIKLGSEKYEQLAKILYSGKIIGLFQGGSEFGPRALGNRSIIASPNKIKIKDRVNSIKSREKWRPLAPVFLEDNFSDFLETSIKSPYMTFVSKINEAKKHLLLGITHIDNTARYQTVNIFQNTEIYNIIKSFYNISGIPALINTSFNVSGEPIVESPIDAIKMFLSTDLDNLCIGDFLISKNQIYNEFKFDYNTVYKGYSSKLSSFKSSDLRIVNTCNNDCLYCLEQSYRKKEKFIKKEEVFDTIKDSIGNKVINFYGGNPLLHPDLEGIIDFAKKSGFESIGLLTNTYGLDENKLSKLTYLGLSSIGFYFNSFDKDKHKLVNNSGFLLIDLIKNIDIIKKSGLFYKAIIHINKQNIDSLHKDIYILNQKYGVKNFEFINYFPFDRPYDLHKDKLDYNIGKNRNNIDKFLKIISLLKINVNFYKFSKDFFGDFLEFYDFENGIINQIGEEDEERLGTENKSFCYEESRCSSCFIKDNCKFYEGF